MAPTLQAAGGSQVSLDIPVTLKSFGSRAGDLRLHGSRQVVNVGAVPAEAPEVVWAEATVVCRSRAADSIRRRWRRRR